MSAFRPFGIYIHIPFCDGKCHYCSFFSTVCSDKAMDEYTDFLFQSLIRWSKRINRPVSTVYFGGGTPSVLGHERLIAILDTVRRYFNVSDKAEITVEVNPSSGGLLDFDKLRNAGFNRLSVGMQSANDEELRLLGRRHSVQDAADTVSAARAAGFGNISLDVMLAIPGQTMESLERTLLFCAEQNVQHISAYILKVEEGTRFYRERDSLSLFDDDGQAAFYEFTVQRLGELGYHQYEISNFSREGYESRHNLLYWHDEEYLGLGPSAHSFADGKRFYYADCFDAFYRGEIVSEGDGGDKEEYIMLALRLTEGLVFERYRERFGDDLGERFFRAARVLDKEGLVKLTPSSLSLTVKGFLVSNSVIAYFIENT
jgi:oxygen-independent coproporphyrinogen-3 oxidase